MYTARKTLHHAGRRIRIGESIGDPDTWLNLDRLIKSGHIEIDPEVIAEAWRIVKARREGDEPPEGGAKAGADFAAVVATVPPPPKSRPVPMDKPKPKPKSAPRVPRAPKPPEALTV